MTTTSSPPARIARRRSDKRQRLDRVAALADGKVLPTASIVAALEQLLAPGDRVVLEGNNQKQADFLSRSLAQVDPARLHDLQQTLAVVGSVPAGEQGPRQSRHGHIITNSLE